MRRKLLIAVLALGTVGGYAAGFASMRSCHNHRRDAFEQHVAKVCVDAARQSDAAAARDSQRAQPQTFTAPVVVNVHPAAPAAAPANAASPAGPSER
jgi:hypothetical protein